MFITHVAIKDNNNVIHSLPKPNRHHDVIRMMAKNGADIPVAGVQGFLTDAGVFADRVEAKEIAINANQIIRESCKSNRLYSEDIW